MGDQTGHAALDAVGTGEPDLLVLDFAAQHDSLARGTGQQATYLLVYEPSHRLRFMVRVGDPVRALHATSAGKAILATMPPDEAKALIDTLTMEQLTENTITDAKQLLADVEQARAQGYAVNREESVMTATTVTAWFTWYRSTYFVTVAGPTFRVEPRLDEVVARLKRACDELANPA